jgi:hypothetical protein
VCGGERAKSFLKSTCHADVGKRHTLIAKCDAWQYQKPRGKLRILGQIILGKRPTPEVAVFL